MQHTNQGFTLIETILYLALFSLVMGGGMVAVYQIIQGTDSASNHVILQEEGDFLIHKITWFLGRPGAKTSAFKLDGKGNMVFVSGSGPAVALNTANVTVSNLSFKKGPQNSLAASFTLDTMLHGYPTRQDFSFKMYLENNP